MHFLKVASLVSSLSLLVTAAPLPHAVRNRKRQDLGLNPLTPGPVLTTATGPSADGNIQKVAESNVGSQMVDIFFELGGKSSGARLMKRQEAEAGTIASSVTQLRSGAIGVIVNVALTGGEEGAAEQQQKGKGKVQRPKVKEKPQEVKAKQLPQEKVRLARKRMLKEKVPLRVKVKLQQQKAKSKVYDHCSKILELLTCETDTLVSCRLPLILPTCTWGLSLENRICFY
ncbi:hypothetical protein BT69DRAFT_239693 [Atractiella rhizophila]|nr:hypothetical protein BT69DRAFT_239693 [Atractiella rhizophila]